MPVRICFICRFHHDSTNSTIFCGFDCNSINQYQIFKGSRFNRNFIPSCPILVPGKKPDFQFSPILI